MALTQITNHTAQAQARLPEQYKNKPRFNAYLQALTDQCQLIENALYPLLSDRLLANATGATLDLVGTLVGQPRNGLGDDQYRSLLQGVIVVQNSDGTADTLLSAVLLIFSAGAAFLREPDSTGTPGTSQLPTATVTAGAGDPSVDPSLFSLLVGLLQQAVDSGVVLDQFFTFNASTGGTLAAAADGGATGWVGGLDDGTGSVGGGLATDVYQNPTA